MSTTMTRQEIEEKLIARAWQDELFKQELLSNPRAAFEKEGIYLPADIKVNVVEESNTSYYLILPINPDKKAELSEAELENVAGGVKVGVSVEW